MAGYYTRELPPDDMAPIVEWDDFLQYCLIWLQDQHLAAVGPTGQGKSVAIHGVVDAKRSFVTYLATKIKDKTLQKYIDDGGYVEFTEEGEEVAPGRRLRTLMSELTNTWSMRRTGMAAGNVASCVRGPAPLAVASCAASVRCARVRGVALKSPSRIVGPPAAASHCGPARASACSHCS